MSTKLDYLKHLETLGIRTIPKEQERKSMIMSTKTITIEPKEKSNIILKNPSLEKINNTNSLDELCKIAQECTNCELHAIRNNVVFGDGNQETKLLFVGEGPGEEEDKTGKPFVGRAGKLLTKIIEAMGLTRADVYIVNIVKCRPPGNRNPSETESLSCISFLQKQINIIKPKIIVTLGAVASKTLLEDPNLKISKIRGSFIDWQTQNSKNNENMIKLMPTFHPAYLLRNPRDKSLVWEDMQKVMKTLGI